VKGEIKLPRVRFFYTRCKVLPVTKRYRYTRTPRLARPTTCVADLPDRMSRAQRAPRDAIQGGKLTGEKGSPGSIDPQGREYIISASTPRSQNLSGFSSSVSTPRDQQSPRKSLHALQPGAIPPPSPMAETANPASCSRQPIESEPVSHTQAQGDSDLSPEKTQASLSATPQEQPEQYQWSIKAERSTHSSADWTSDCRSREAENDDTAEGCPRCASFEKKLEEMQRIVNRGARNHADGMDLMREMQRGHNEAVQVLQKRIASLEADLSEWQQNAEQMPKIKEVSEPSGW